MIKFACPGCSASFNVPDDKAGKSGKCPKCQAKFVIPAAGGSAPAASAPAADQPVEIQPCPKCSTRLSVMPGDIGLDIECPSCQTVFKALNAGASVPAPKSPSKPAQPAAVDDEEDDERPAKKSGSSRRDEDEDDRPKKKSSRRDDDDEEDDRPKKKTSSRAEEDDEDEDDRPKKKSSRRDDDDRPSKRGSRRGDDDEDDDRPSRRKGKKRRSGGDVGESKRMTAALLGLFLGALGVHKFYLGYTTPAIIQIVLTICSAGTLGWLGIIEGIIYLTKTDEEFIETYQRNEKQWF